jgi:bifunctional NMN adenylyltransferase/nudix hydrolase
MRKYNYAKVIMRAQIYHNGHHSIIKQALELANRVIVFIGSANRSRSPKNPFSYNERVKMISSCFTTDELSRIGFVASNDYPHDDDRWANQIRKKMNAVIELERVNDFQKEKVILVGHTKADTNYLKWFPECDFQEVVQQYKINSSELREIMYSQNTTYHQKWTAITDYTPCYEFLFKLNDNPLWKMKHEYDAIANEKAKFKTYPFKETLNFVTTDAVVIQDEHVLMIKRINYPGKGLWALPGGFLNNDELIIDGCLRELKEETNLSLDENDLVYREVFDELNRSSRARTITHAFLFDPKFDSVENVEQKIIRANDDAYEAKFIKLSELNPSEIFEDHYFIILKMVEDSKLFQSKVKGWNDYSL